MTSDAGPTVLLTGFGPFPGVARNASGDLVKVLVRLARRELPEYRFASAVLPVEWTRIGGRIASLHARHTPVLALHFGVAAGARGLRVETTASNICRSSPDAAGHLPKSPALDASGPAVRKVTLPVRSIVATLKSKGYPASVSDDAGSYLCNAALYQSLAIAERNGAACRVGFVHMPADLEPAGMPAAPVEAALEIVRLSLKHEHSACL